LSEVGSEVIEKHGIPGMALQIIIVKEVTDFTKNFRIKKLRVLRVFVVN